MSDKKLLNKKSARFAPDVTGKERTSKKDRNKSRNMSFKELQAYLKKQRSKSSKRIAEKKNKLAKVSQKKLNLWVRTLINRFIKKDKIKDDSILKKSYKTQQAAVMDLIDPDNNATTTFQINQALRNEFAKEITHQDIYEENEYLIDKLADKLDQGNLVVISDKHQIEEPFLYASLLMDHSYEPGVFMIEGPIGLDSDTMTDKEFNDRIETWNQAAWRNQYQANAAKEAKRLGWKVVSVDMMDEANPKDDRTNKHKGRQRYIGGMVKSVMDDKRYPGGKILVIGTDHITGNDEHLNGALSTWANRKTKNEARLDDTERARIWVMDKDERNSPQAPDRTVDIKRYHEEILEDVYNKTVARAKIEGRVDDMVKRTDVDDSSQNKKSVSIQSRRLFKQLEGLHDGDNVIRFVDSANRVWKSEYKYDHKAGLNKQRTYTLTDVTNESPNLYIIPSELDSIDVQPDVVEQQNNDNDRSVDAQLDIAKSIETYYNLQKNLKNTDDQDSLEKFIDDATKINDQSLKLLGKEIKDQQVRDYLENLMVSIATDILQAKQDLQLLNSNK